MKKWIIKFAYWLLKRTDNAFFSFDSMYLLKKLPLEVAVYDRQGRYVFVNDYYCPEESLRNSLVGKDDYYYFSQIGADIGPLEKRRQNRVKALSDKRIIHFTESINLTAKNKTLYYKRYFRPLDNGDYTAFVGSDLTAVIHAQKELKYLAYHDKLTGLFNRDAFNEQVDQVLMELERLADGTIVALLFCDLDNFKLVNDSLGHDYGDRVLQDVSRRLRQTLRKSDQIYRIGGDEFVVVLRNLKNDFEAGMVAQKLIDVLSKPYEINNTTINYVSASVGIVLMPQNGTNREVLIKKADTAMYLAKKHGKKEYRYYSDSHTKSAVRSMRMEKNLRELVINGDFNQQLDIVYQPIYEKEKENSYRIAGTEALIRWNNPDIGAVRPSQFIPIAEKSNLIIPIGQWVLERALKDFRQLGQYDRTDKLYLSVNLSTKQLHSKELIEIIAGLIKELDIKPQKIQCELTETSYLEQNERVIRNLRELIELGIRIAIDDFGSGYASMAYLQRIPASAIKIDRLFVSNLAKNKHHQELIRSIIQLGKNMNMDIIAEGVEDISQLRFLDEHKCNKYQGFLFGRPTGLNTFRQMLERRPRLEFKLN